MYLGRIKTDTGIKFINLILNELETLNTATSILVEDLVGDFVTGFKVNSDPYSVSPSALITPVTPTKIVCAGKNYLEHVIEINMKKSEEILIFFKPISSLLNPGAPIILPPESERVEFEGELALVVAKEAKNLNSDNVLEHIFGYTIANDVTARDLQFRDDQWSRAKGFDTFCPVGPIINTNIKSWPLQIKTEVDGVLKQNDTTAAMMHSITDIMIWITRIMTLQPGDLILTGTPAGTDKLIAGQQVAVTISELGTLRNKVKKSIN